ncbi:MAG TPA: hypothetical protein VLL48_08890 [Longimicrobiales bacterium]|nr:hypothetical protein [Longimicrobiales bacterium]
MVPHGFPNARRAAAALVTLGLLAAATPPSPLGAQITGQRIGDTDQLLDRAMAAFEALPRAVGPENAPGFGDALAYLYAYEQRLLREERRELTGLPAEAMVWMSDNIAGLRTGKADRFRDDALMLERGVESLETVRGSRDGNGRFWDLAGYVTALANLYAYVQVGGSASAARGGIQELGSMRGRLVTAGVKSDAGRDVDASWVPSSPRPGTSPAVTLNAQVVQVIPQQVEIARPEAGGDAGKDSAIRELRAENEELRARVAELTAESRRLRAELESGGDRTGSFMDWSRKLMANGDIRGAHAVATALIATGSRDGAVHLLLAEIYEAAVASRPDPTVRDRALHWLALDHLEAAARLARAEGAPRGDVQEVATRMRKVRAEAPGRDELASVGWTAGQTIRIDYPPWEWVRETTRVR